MVALASVGDFWPIDLALTAVLNDEPECVQDFHPPL